MTQPASSTLVETRTVHDPFLNKDVQVSSKLVDRLQGRYANGPIMENGEPEFGWREFQTPPIQHEAAARITELEAQIDVLRHGTKTAYDAMEKAIKLCQIDLGQPGWEDEHPSKRDLRLAIFRELDFPLAVVGNTERSPDGAKLIGTRIVEAEARALAAESQLERVRAETIEECAKVADEMSWLLNVQSQNAKDAGKSSDMYRINTAFHALSNAAISIRALVGEKK